MKTYIRIAPNVEYFTDYDRFREAQICCTVAEDGTAASRTAASCTRCGTIFPNGLSSCYVGRYIVKYAHCTMADKSWNDLPTTPENCKL